MRPFVNYETIPLLNELLQSKNTKQYIRIHVTRCINIGFQLEKIKRRHLCPAIIF